jgi:hypothetical protein
VSDNNLAAVAMPLLGESDIDSGLAQELDKAVLSSV